VKGARRPKLLEFRDGFLEGKSKPFKLKDYLPALRLD